MIVRSCFPGRSCTRLKKSRRFLRLFALPPGNQLHKVSGLGLGLNDCSVWIRAPSLLAASLAAHLPGLESELLFGFPPRRTSSWKLSHIDLVESANYCSVICPDLPAGRTPGRCRASVSGFGVGVRSRNDCPVASFSVVFCRFS